MALATIAILPLVVVFYALSIKGADKLMPQYTALLIKMNTAIIEYTKGMQVIKAFGLTASSYKKLTEACFGYA